MGNSEWTNTKRRAKRALSKACLTELAELNQHQLSDVAALITNELRIKARRREDSLERDKYNAECASLPALDVRQAELPHTGREVVESRTAGAINYQLERIRCGKESCRCYGSNGTLHGPYWYAYFRDGKRKRSQYIGKIFRELPFGRSHVPASARDQQWAEFKSQAASRRADADAHGAKLEAKRRRDRMPVLPDA